MGEEVLYELGVDFDSTLNFHDGDIILSKYDDNLVQAIVNRLNIGLDELDLFYLNYGSIMLNFLGWKATDETISFIKSELESVLKSEGRLDSWEYDVKYLQNGKINIELTLYPNPNYSINANFTVNEDGVTITEEEEE